MKDDSRSAIKEVLVRPVAKNSDGSPLYTLSLKARPDGKPVSNQLDRVLHCCDRNDVPGRLDLKWLLPYAYCHEAGKPNYRAVKKGDLILGLVRHQFGYSAQPLLAISPDAFRDLTHMDKTRPPERYFPVQEMFEEKDMTESEEREWSDRIGFHLGPLRCF